MKEGYKSNMSIRAYVDCRAVATIASAYVEDGQMPSTMSGLVATVLHDYAKLLLDRKKGMQYETVEQAMATLEVLHLRHDRGRTKGLFNSLVADKADEGDGLTEKEEKSKDALKEVMDGMAKKDKKEK